MKRHDKDAFSYRFRKGRIPHEAISVLPYAMGLDAQRMRDIKEKGGPAVPFIIGGGGPYCSLMENEGFGGSSDGT